MSPGTSSVNCVPTLSPVRKRGGSGFDQTGEDRTFLKRNGLMRYHNEIAYFYVYLQLTSLILHTGREFYKMILLNFHSGNDQAHIMKPVLNIYINIRFFNVKHFIYISVFEISRYQIKTHIKYTI